MHHSSSIPNKCRGMKSKKQNKYSKREEKFIRYMSIFMSIIMGLLSVPSMDVYASTKTLDESTNIAIVSEIQIPIESAIQIVSEIALTNLVIHITETPLKEDEKQDEISIKEDVQESAEPEVTAETEFEIEIVEESNGFIYCDQIPLSLDLQQYTYNACIERGLDYPLVLALMWRESRFQTDAIHYNAWNGTHDSGIMQINDCNKGWLSRDHGINNLFDPYQNIDAGTILLGNLTAKYGEHNALMAYQYGEGGMQKKFNQGIYTSEAITKLYVKRDEFRNILQMI